MLGFNGGLIGTPRTATTIEASGIWNLNESNLFIGQGLWPQNILAPDPYFSDVSLLLAGDGTNGSTTVKDYSGLALASTAVGDAQISTAQSKYYGSSIAFDGNGDYLTITDSNAFEFESGDFTIECWYYFSGSYAGYQPLVAKNGGGGTRDSWVLQTNRGTANKPAFIASSGTADWDIVLISNTIASQNSWNHIAAARLGDVFTLYLNGVAVASATQAITISNNTLPLSIAAYSSGNLPFAGYINDLRITKGVARYTANFTPPDSFLRGGLDPYLSLLLRANGTNGSTAIIDESPSPKAITVVGDAQISTAQSKYGGSSIYFDGSGDYLTITDSNAFEFGSGDFTIELWFYMPSLPASFALFGGLSGKNFYFGVGTYSDNRYLVSYDGSTEINQTSGVSITAGVWYHAAHCRSNGTARLFLNGELVRSGSFGSITGTTGYQVGASPFYNDYRWYGYIDDLRITKGIARYTSNFTPPGAL